MFISLYRKILPYSLRKSLYELFVGKIVYFFRNIDLILQAKFVFLFGFLLPKTEKNQALKFIGQHGITSYPYDYMFEYKNINIEVAFDEKHKLPFVLHNNKKLYFPEFYTVDKVKTDYRALLTEQDIRASHRYVKSYNELTDKTLLDIGSAEGIFALDTIEIVKDAIIFECEQYWLKPLKATFEPWKDKVKFIEKYVGDVTSGKFITIDDFLKDFPKENLFLKMDIEGAERKALEGTKNTLQSAKNTQLAICTYHQPNDPEYIANFLSKFGFQYEFSDGLMYWEKRFSKGLIRAFKS